jgi:hypothetical protein
MKSFRRLLPCALWGATLGLLPMACVADAVVAVPTDEVAARLPILATSSPTREELLLRLGPPSASYEDDAVLAWRVVERDRELRPTAQRMTLEPGAAVSWEVADFSVVVAFAPSGRVRRYALVPVR